MSDEESVRAGWYSDPDAVNTLRFWDGDDWTDDVAPARRESLPIPPSLETLAVVAAILLPPLGFLIGLAMIGKSHSAANTLWISSGMIAAGAVVLFIQSGVFA